MSGNGDGENHHNPNHQGHTMGATLMGIMLAFNVVMNVLRHGSWIYRTWCKKALGYHIYEAKSKNETNRRICRLICLAASAKGQELHHFSLVEPCGTRTHLELPSSGARKITVFIQKLLASLHFAMQNQV